MAQLFFFCCCFVASPFSPALHPSWDVCLRFFARLCSLPRGFGKGLPLLLCFFSLSSILFLVCFLFFSCSLSLSSLSLVQVTHLLNSFQCLPRRASSSSQLGFPTISTLVLFLFFYFIFHVFHLRCRGESIHLVYVLSVFISPSTNGPEQELWIGFLTCTI